MGGYGSGTCPVTRKKNAAAQNDPLCNSFASSAPLRRRHCSTGAPFPWPFPASLPLAPGALRPGRSPAEATLQPSWRRHSGDDKLFINDLHALFFAFGASGGVKMKKDGEMREAGDSGDRQRGETTTRPQLV